MTMLFLVSFGILLNCVRKRKCVLIFANDRQTLKGISFAKWYLALSEIGTWIAFLLFRNAHAMNISKWWCWYFLYQKVFKNGLVWRKYLTHECISINIHSNQWFWYSDLSHAESYIFRNISGSRKNFFLMLSLTMEKKKINCPIVCLFYMAYF